MISPAMQSLVTQIQAQNPDLVVTHVGPKPAEQPKDVPASVLPLHTSTYEYVVTRNHAYRRATGTEADAARTSKRIIRGHNEAVECVLSNDTTMLRTSGTTMYPARFWYGQLAAHNRRKTYAGRVCRGIAAYNAPFDVATLELHAD